MFQPLHRNLFSSLSSKMLQLEPVSEVVTNAELCGGATWRNQLNQKSVYELIVLMISACLFGNIPWALDAFQMLYLPLQ